MMVDKNGGDGSDDESGAGNDGVGNDSEGSDDKVGYGHPPREHQFKPGQSGNPKGRKKGTKKLARLIELELDRPMTLQVGGETKTLKKREALALRLVNDALGGKTKQIALLMQHVKEQHQPEPFEMSKDDDIAFDQILDQWGKGGKENE